MRFDCCLKTDNAADFNILYEFLQSFVEQYNHKVSHIIVEISPMINVWETGISMMFFIFVFNFYKFIRILNFSCYGKFSKSTNKQRGEDF